MRALLLCLSTLAAGGAGCLSPLRFGPAASQTAAPAPRFREPIVAGQLVIHADFHLPAGHRMISELVSERQLICDRLAMTAGAEPIHVYLFGEEADYRGHVAAEYPGFPERRAIFVETDVKLSVYAHWSDHVADDLRHEVAHGYLHSTTPGLPLWLDEGLAEYFEVARGRRGVNPAHVDYLVAQRDAAGWTPDLARLEKLTAAGELTQLDYAEAWLWVHFLLESPAGAPEILQQYLADLRREGAARPLNARLTKRPSESSVVALAETKDAAMRHLASLAH